MRILLLTAIMLMASSVYAGLYKWVDEEGNVHYSQKAPRGQQYERLKEAAPAPTNSKSLYPSIDKTAQNKKKSTTVAAETAKNEEIRAKNCTSAKKRLNTYQVYRRIRDKDGNITILDDNERASQIDKAKQAINDYCN